MPMQIKHFDNTLPYSTPLENLFHGHTLYMGRSDSMNFTNYVLQVVDVAHETASTKSRTVQKSRSIPAAIAGVQRNVL